MAGVDSGIVEQEGGNARGVLELVRIRFFDEIICTNSTSFTTSRCRPYGV